MRIWFAAAQTGDTYGGVFRSVTSLAEALRRRGHDVSLCWSIRNDKLHGIVFPLRLFCKLLLSWRQPPHWIIARSSDGLLCALASKLRLVKTRAALHNHGWEEKVYETEKRLKAAVVSHPTTWKARLFRFPLLRTTLTSAHVCICGTIEEARWLKKRYPRCAGDITVVPNGCDVAPQPFWPLRHDWPQKFLAIGGFTWKKNIGHAITVFSLLRQSCPEAKLFCVGTGPVPDAIQTIIGKLGNAVTIVEQELPEAMTHWYETCPFLISASRYEGGRSLAILEAQNHGMVVFATALPSTKELIRDRTNGILLSGCDAAADCGRILSTCGDVALCKAIGSAAWRSASRQSWERQARRLERVLDIYY